MNIVLVRHGEAASSWGDAPDPGLSELGHQQAGATADELLSVVGAKLQLISSPLLRARETAQPFAERLALPVVIDDAYSEIPSPVPLSERQAWLKIFMTQTWPEQPASLQQWRSSMIERLQALQTPTVIFTHFLVMNTLLGHLLEREETLSFWPDNASFLQLRRTDQTIEIVDLGRQLASFVN